MKHKKNVSKLVKSVQEIITQIQLSEYVWIVRDLW